jgi:hypothetical protein
MKYENKGSFGYGDITALVSYLGTANREELNVFIQGDIKEVENELERLVRKEKLESKVVCGELVYRFIGD